MENRANEPVFKVSEGGESHRPRPRGSVVQAAACCPVHDAVLHPQPPPTGTYFTHEAKGADDAADADTAIINAEGGHTNSDEKKEYYI